MKGIQEKYPATVWVNGKKKRVRLWQIWAHMRERCSNTKHPHYKKYYIDKGIKVCQEWENYQIFAEWAYENGYDDTLTIDRIDNTKNYCPENCRWIPLDENCRHAQLGLKRTEADRKANSKRNMGGRNGNAKQVICIETGQIFPTAKEAALSVGLKRASVAMAIRKGFKSKNLHWAYVKKEQVKDVPLPVRMR